MVLSKKEIEDLDATLICISLQLGFMIDVIKGIKERQRKGDEEDVFSS